MRKRVEEPGKIIPSDAEGIKLLCRWLWDGQCISAYFSSLQLGETSLKFNISVEQDVEVQNLKAATVHVYDYYKPGRQRVTIIPPTQTQFCLWPLFPYLPYSSALSPATPSLGFLCTKLLHSSSRITCFSVLVMKLPGTMIILWCVCVQNDCAFLLPLASGYISVERKFLCQFTMSSPAP